MSCIGTTCCTRLVCTEHTVVRAHVLPFLFVHRDRSVLLARHVTQTGHAPTKNLIKTKQRTNILGETPKCKLHHSQCFTRMYAHHTTVKSSIDSPSLSNTQYSLTLYLLFLPSFLTLPFLLTKSKSIKSHRASLNST